MRSRRTRRSAWVSSQRENPAVDSSGAVADSIPVDAQLIHQGQMKIRERRALEPDMALALEIAGASTGEDHRNINRRMALAVRPPSALHQGEVIHPGAG